MRFRFHDGSRRISFILVLCARVPVNGPGPRGRRSAARSGPTMEEKRSCTPRLALQPRWSHDKVPPEEFCYHTADGKVDKSFLLSWDVRALPVDPKAGITMAAPFRL